MYNFFPKTTFIILITFLSIQTFAQEIEFREVSKEELQQRKSTIDTAAGAEILYYNKEVYYDVSFTSVHLITEVHKRIKFYNNRPEDLAYATEKLYLYVEDEPEEVSKIRAYTYNLVGGEVEETKLDRKQIFDKELSRRFNEASFTMPKVNKGSVIDIYYKLRSPYFFNIEELKFQFDIPAKLITAKVSTPKNFIFNRISKGSIIPKLNIESQIDRRMNTEANIYNYEVKNVPALRDESFVDNIENYRAGVLFELKSTEDSYGVRKHYSKSWQDVARNIAFKDDYDREMNRTGIFEDDIDLILSNLENEKNLQTVNEIFKHVKQNIKWNDEKSKYFDNGIRKTYKEKVGNSADINLTLVAMLRYAGFNSSPVVISTRDNLKPLFPTIDRLNYVIAYVNLNGKDYFLDATDKYSEINILPIRDYNWNGVMVDTPNKQWKLIDLKKPDASGYISMINATIAKDGKAVGKVQIKKSNHYGYLFRKKYFSMSEEDYIRDKESSFGDMFIKDYLAENTEGDGAIVEKFSYEIENVADIVGDKIFITPLMFLADDENPFKLEERNFPVDFVYPFTDKYIINMKLPEGYEVTSLPKPVKLSFGENLGQYQFIISNSGNFIRLNVDFDINTNIIAPKDYEFLKQFFNEKIKKESEQIVLTKIK